MEAFTYKNGILHAEDVSVRDLADQHGTPLYIYSRTHLREQLRGLRDAMADVDPLICYSIKANSNAAVIQALAAEGAGCDIVSAGELFRARRAGIDADKIVFAGVGKTHDEIEYALKEGILFFTVESEPEAARISECATRMGCTGRIAFRVNPDVDPQTHKYVSTGKKESKFGMDLDRTLSACETAAALPNVELVGLHMHIGSQILTNQPFVDALAKVQALCAQLQDKHTAFEYIDIGGGIGIQYEPGQTPLTPETYAAEIAPMLKDLGLKVVMEPGRYLAGNAGILVSRVQYIKENAFKKFIVVDAAMNDLIRPSLYGSYHDIVSVRETSETVHGDVVGPVCESGDFLATERDLPAVVEGDLIAARSAGAYGFVMASSYNSRPLPAEVMVEGSAAHVIRNRGTWDDLVEKEQPYPVA